MNLSKSSDCMIDLINYIRTYSNDDEVAITIHLTATECQITTHSKTREDLEKEGISMRNLKGDFVTRDLPKS